jgi:hypothetical protein
MIGMQVEFFCFDPLFPSAKILCFDPCSGISVEHLIKFADKTGKQRGAELGSKVPRKSSD